MQLLCTLRDRCRQRPRNTRYQADATPYLGRTSPAGSHQLAAGALIRSPRRRGRAASGARTLAVPHSNHACRHLTSSSIATPWRLSNGTPRQFLSPEALHARRPSSQAHLQPRMCWRAPHQHPLRIGGGDFVMLVDKFDRSCVCLFARHRLLLTLRRDASAS